MLCEARRLLSDAGEVCSQPCVCYSITRNSDQRERNNDDDFNQDDREVCRLEVVESTRYVGEVEVKNQEMETSE